MLEVDLADESGVAAQLNELADQLQVDVSLAIDCRRRPLTVAVRRVLELPERVLKLPAGATGTGRDSELIEDLLDTMGASPACVGLGRASDRGLSPSPRGGRVRHPKTTVCHGLIVLLDPLVLEQGGRVTGREGCMSVPHLTADVARATRIVVRGRGSEGEEVVISSAGFEARALQHELDHLDGLLILDRVESSTDLFKRRVYR